MATPRLARFVCPEGNATTDKKLEKQYISQLKRDIEQFRHDHFPPESLRQIQDLPIFASTPAQVEHVIKQWQPLFDRAYSFYPDTRIGPDAPPLPSTLGLPLIVQHVERLHLTRTHAKESKTFGAVGPLIERCGPFTDAEQWALHQWIGEHPTGKFVAHRAFIDLRAYVFRRNIHTQEAIPPERVRFYRTGLILATLPGFEVLDSRQTPRKQRSDAYKDPLAFNEVWQVYGRTDSDLIEVTDEVTE